MVEVSVADFMYTPFRVAGLAFAIAFISVSRLDFSCSSVKEAFPTGTWMMFALSSLY